MLVTVKGLNCYIEYPAAYEEVIAVGAVDTSAQKTEESAVGEEVELVAPGEQILSDSMLGLETVVSDTFCHSAYVKKDGKYVKLKDEGNNKDDNPTVCPNRYKDAQKAMKKVLQNCYYGKVGSEIDFLPEKGDWGKSRKYYLKNILKCAKDSAENYSVKELEKVYKAINYVE